MDQKVKVYGVERSFEMRLLLLTTTRVVWWKCKAEKQHCRRLTPCGSSAGLVWFLAAFEESGVGAAVEIGADFAELVAVPA